MPDTPLATYRLQLSSAFTFADAEAIVPYLADLGISHVYASPVLAARPGSPHGYDVVDHTEINRELGGEEGLASFTAALKRHGMAVVMDVVPNHMCIATVSNRWWHDVLENGPSSPYSRFFDIDWHPPKPDLAEKVLLPVLGDQYGRVLENQEIVVEYEGGAFRARYFQSCFPIGPATVSAILAPMVEPVRARLSESDQQLLELESIITACVNLPRRSETDEARVRERQREKEIIKRRLSVLVESSPAVREEMERTLADLNGQKGNPPSFDRLEALLANQAYRLSFWRVAAEEINYRRFFDINDLAAIRIEEPAVLEAVHAKAFELLGAGQIDGLRIDHVDGLRDPERYLTELQAAASGAAGHPTYVVVEKILTGDEALPPWPVAGTTGYEFLGLVNGLFVDQGAARSFERLFAQLRGAPVRFEDLLYDAKRLILRASLSSELFVLANRLDRLSERHRWSRDFTRNALHHALGEVIACFPVYRTYIQEGSHQVTAEDRKHILAALAAAKRRNRSMSASTFDFIGDILLLRDPEGAPPDEIADRRELVIRMQQLTGPVMAKGLEDTTFYRYYPLASLAEVGSRPSDFGVALERFHEWCRRRQETWPRGLSATATHDTKRGEDLRARLDVLSEMPREWRATVRRWHRLVRRLRAEIEEQTAPDAAEEYLFFQTALGAWPASESAATPERAAEHAALVDRVAAYMNKALREAKQHSSWISPNEAYETAVDRFVRAALADTRRNRFLQDLRAFAARIAPAGIAAGLGQALIKITAPGVPDFYQGTEILDLSLVDPDNRKPVDYPRRRELMALVAGDGHDHDLPARLRELTARPDGDALKLLVIRRALDLRRRRRALFEEGAYVPLWADGLYRRHVVAFARRRGDDVAITCVARFLHQLPGALPFASRDAWAGAALSLPRDLAGQSFRDVLTGTTVERSSGQLPLSALFATLPVSLLELAG
jgi:(1->4)-alpha-D-glucan 1-alpha-D-glucosylmutase